MEGMMSPFRIIEIDGLDVSLFEEDMNLFRKNGLGTLCIPDTIGQLAMAFEFKKRCDVVKQLVFASGEKRVARRASGAQAADFAVNVHASVMKPL